MHLNYHFLRFLCPQLENIFVGMEISSCFSQNKDELVIECRKNDEIKYIRANLLPVISSISFPDDFKRGKKNTVSLFPEILEKKVSSVKIISFERAFVLTLDNGDRLLFKLFGTRSNILYYKARENLPSKLFRNELKEDWEINPHDLERDLDISYEHFVQLEGNASKFLPTLGKIPREWLKSKGYIEAGLNKRWTLMQELMDILEVPMFHIIRQGQDFEISLLPEENSLFNTIDPVEACNQLFKYRVVVQAFEKEKNQWIKQFEEQKKRTQAYLEKTSQKLQEIESEASPSQIADIIMANLHQIPAGATEATLFNFYSGKEEKIKLKRDQSPQKYAENLYRKGKNRKKEINQLYENLEAKENFLLQTEQWLEEIKLLEDFRTLKDFVKRNHLVSKNKIQEEQVPFKRYDIEGFEVLVGKSAKANDEMLRYFAWKEDLWLHAKDVSGSHVLIKYRSGQKFPKSVIERAAELAAYYSKNKNETLAPVIYTPSKFVRKIKGSPAGAVMVDKETVVLVQPKGPVSE